MKNHPSKGSEKLTKIKGGIIVSDLFFYMETNLCISSV